MNIKLKAIKKILIAGITITCLTQSPIHAQTRAKVIRIISVQGGEMRALIPLTVLQYITQHSKKRFNQLFDVAAGSSTGAIVSAILSNGSIDQHSITPQELAAIYEDYAKKTMGNPKLNRAPALQTKSMMAIFNRVLGNKTLGNSKIKLVIPSYNVQQQHPMIFNSWSAAKHNDYYIKDVVMASSSTPAHFAQFPLSTVKGKKMGHYIDAGISFDNQPVLNAYLLAKKNCPKCQFVIAALGTGATPPLTPTSVRQSQKWHLKSWLKHFNFYYANSIPQTAINANNAQIMKLLAQTPGSNIIYYHQFNAPLSAQQINANISGNPKILQAYINAGKRAVKNNKKELNKLVTLLNQ